MQERTANRGPGCRPGRVRSTYTSEPEDDALHYYGQQQVHWIHMSQQLEPRNLITTHRRLIPCVKMGWCRRCRCRCQIALQEPQEVQKQAQIMGHRCLRNSGSMDMAFHDGRSEALAQYEGERIERNGHQPNAPHGEMV